jgi:hypothetical protein
MQFNNFLFKARGYAAQPAAAAAARAGDVQSTTLPNKLIVASSETGSAISRVSIAFRYEILNTHVPQKS